MARDISDVWIRTYSRILGRFLRRWQRREIECMEILTPYLNEAQANAIGWASRP